MSHKTLYLRTFRPPRTAERDTLQVEAAVLRIDVRIGSVIHKHVEVSGGELIYRQRGHPQAELPFA
jgi:hypothetical protein